MPSSSTRAEVANTSIWLSNTPMIPEIGCSVISTFASNIARLGDATTDGTALIPGSNDADVLAGLVTVTVLDNDVPFLNERTRFFSRK